MTRLNTAFQSDMDALAKKMKDPSLNSESTFQATYGSTFLPLDFMNGINLETMTLDGRYKFKCTHMGITGGSIVMLLAKPGAGKTTLAEQITTGMSSRYKESSILHEDAEGGTNRARIQIVSGWNSLMFSDKYKIRDQGINSTSFFIRAYNYCKNKIKLANEYPTEMYHYTGMIDEHGNPVKAIIPSFIILDSLALLGLEGLSKEEALAGNMNAAQTAKANAQVLKRLAPILKSSNTTLFIINHLNCNIDIGMVKSAAQINYLDQKEVVPGGNTPLYLSQNIFKLTPGTKLKDDKEFGINGYINKVKMIKSRTNRSGQEINLVYDQEYGFDRLLSNFLFVKEAGLVSGTGRYYLPQLPNIKFYQKQIREKFLCNASWKEQQLLNAALKELILERGSKMISGEDLMSSKNVTKLKNDNDIDNALLSSLEDDDMSDEDFFNTLLGKAA